MRKQVFTKLRQNQALLLKWIFVVCCLLVGVASGIGTLSMKWAIVSIAIYSVPFFTQFAKYHAIRVYGIWVGVFLLAQSILSPYVDSDYRTLQPNLELSFVVRGDVITGIHGIQTVTTDEKGYRTTKSIRYENKPHQTIRVFAIGGSTTEQMMLDDRETWTHLLQTRLDQEWPNYNVEVINTGLAGLRAKHHLATLKRILSFEPDIVLFLTGINDWNYHIYTDSPGENIIRRVLDRYLIDKTMLGKAIMFVENVFFPDKKTVKGEVQVFFGGYYSNQNDSLNRHDKVNFKPDEVSQQYKGYISKIGQICHKKRIVCVFITQPTAYRYGVSEELKKRFWMTPPNREYTVTFDGLAHIAKVYNDYLESYAKLNGHMLCDIDSKIPPTLDYFYDDTHFNEGGAQRVAGLLAQCFVDSKENIDRHLERSPPILSRK